MGGKHKQAQRTKNNARPSSSGRSAELLGNTTPSFVGFTAVKDGGFVPTLPGFTVANAEDLDPNLNPNFQMVLKKMGKKDSTTKLKALQEFTELINNSEPEVVKAVLPFWPRLYCILAVDVEHRVREAAHQAHRAVVLKAKRNIAPFLRQLAGPWFTSQYDTYPPAATAASQAFQDAFPPNKVIEAIVFCQQEILDYIYDNLIVQTAQTMGNPSSMTAEEMEAKYQRVVISSLHGYALYLQKLPTDQLEAAEQANRKLIASKKFWKLSKHNCGLIRNAWFSVLVSLCQKAPKFLADEGSHVALSVFGNLDETDPVVLPTVWEAALHVLSTVEDCWQHVNPEKLVLPKLWHILREGGQGNASAIFPNLLPLLSKIPSNVRSNKQDFYDRFFDNMRQGMHQKSVIQSVSESNAVAQGYIECLQYVVMLQLSDAAFCECVIKKHLIAAIMVMFSEQKLHVISTALFHQVSGLVHHWSQNCSNEEYPKLLEVFWKTLCSEQMKLFALSPDGEALDHNSPSDSWLFNRQVNMCFCLRSPRQQRSSQKLNVRFICEDKDTDDELEIPKVSEISEENLHVNEGLQTLVHTISACYLRQAEQSCNPVFLSYLVKLMRTFQSRNLFSALLSKDQDTESDTLVKLYDTLFYKWLVSDNMCTEDVVIITFFLLTFLTPEEKTHVLETLCQVSNESVLEWCVKASLEHRSEPSVQKWLHSKELRKILSSLVHNISSKASSVSKHILKCCLSKMQDGSLLISSETFSDIVLEFAHLLSSAQDLHCISFVTEVVQLLFNGDIRLSEFLHSNEAVEKLLLVLFHLSLKKNVETNDGWCAGVTALARLHGNCSEKFTSLTEMFAQVTAKELLSRGSMSEETVDHVVSTVIAYLHAAARCFPSEVNETTTPLFKLCNIFLNCLLPTLKYQERNLATICLCTEQLKGTLTFNTATKVENKSEMKNTKKDIPLEEGMVQYVDLLLFSARLISKLSESRNPDEDDAIEETDVTKISREDIQVLEEHLLANIYAIAVCRSFSSNYRSSVYYYKMFSKYSKALQDFKMLTKMCDSEALEYVISITKQRSCQYGNLWLQALYILHSEVLNQKDCKSLYEDLISAENSIINSIEVCQVFLPYFKTEDIRNDTSSVDDRLTLLAWWLQNLDGPVPVESAEYVIEHLDWVLNWYQQDKKDDILFDCKVRWPQVKSVAAAARFLAAVIEKCPELMSSAHWDATIVSLASWMLTMKYSRNMLLSAASCCGPPLVPVTPKETVTDDTKKESRHVSSPDVAEKESSSESEISLSQEHSGALFAVSVCCLFKALSDFILNSECDDTSLKMANVAVSVATEEDSTDAVLLRNKVKQFKEKVRVEWKDVFANDVYDILIATFRTFSDVSKTRTLWLLDLPVLESLGEAMMHIEPQYFFVSESKNNSESVDSLVQCCCDLIHSPVIPLQLAAYHLLVRMVPSFIELDTPAAFAASSEDKEGEGLSLTKLQKTLEETQTVVDTMLLEIRLGNSCTVCPFTDAITYTTAYLLLWSIVLDMCGKAVTELRYQYATMLRNSGILNSLLQNVFRLMPEQVLQTTHPKFKLATTSEMFSSPPSLKFSQPSTSELLERMSCWVYYSTLRRLPAFVRQWWSDIEPRVASLMEQVTSAHCSPSLCAEEMKSVQSKNLQNRNMVVKVHPSVREVVAVYKVDESSMELSVHLPNNYPLGPVRVESGKQLVDSGQWRNWMMQLTVFLTHQNGSIWDGLALWKSNLDKKFEGLEECYICFSILHGSNFQIPRQCCSTCKKKFHSPCLYQWFSTSNKATCPICRNLF